LQLALFGLRVLTIMIEEVFEHIGIGSFRGDDIVETLTKAIKHAGCVNVIFPSFADG
jgi:hypothetical protein